MKSLAFRIGWRLAFYPALMRVWGLLFLGVNISSISPVAAAARLTTPLLLTRRELA